MTKQLRILVIEDNEKHLVDVRKATDKAQAVGLIDKADIATTYEEAIALLDVHQYDGIISDIFFPYDNHTLEFGGPVGWCKIVAMQCRDLLNEYYFKDTDPAYSKNYLEPVQEWVDGYTMHPTGIIICQAAIERGLPIVMCTDTYHHGFGTEPINVYLRELKNKIGHSIEMVDACSRSYGDIYVGANTDHKNWEKAIVYLIPEMEGLVSNEDGFEVFDQRIEELEELLY